MDIAKLYEELGREIDTWQALNKLEDEERQEHKKRQEIISEKQRESRERIAILQEAINMSNKGTDPLIAKMTARESLEEKAGDHKYALRRAFYRQPLPNLSERPYDGDDGETDESSDRGY